jgi:hypothetical protein
MAGGTIETYVVATSTPKPTYTDQGLTALNTNPVVLDAAGRCTMWADGDLRLVLRDATGNLIWDTTATTIVSAAMQPVVTAPTIADAQNLLGITGLATAADVASEISAEQTARIAADNTLTTNLNNEITRATNAENAIQHQLGGGAFQAGTSNTNSSGYDAVTFTYAYTGADPGVYAQTYGSALTDVSLVVQTTLTGFTVWSSNASGVGVSVGYMWLSFGTY